MLVVNPGAVGTSVVLNQGSYLHTLEHYETVTTRGSGTIEQQLP